MGTTEPKPRKQRKRKAQPAQDIHDRGRPVKPVDTAKEQGYITAARIAIMRVFRVHHTLLDRHCKKPEAVIPRQALFYLLYHVAAMPQHRIAATVSLESYATNTVTNSMATVRRVMTVDSAYRGKVLKAMKLMMADLNRK